MIRDFGNKISFNLYHTGETKKLPREYWQRAIYLQDIMDAVTSIEDLKFKGFPPSLRLHKLKGSRKDEFAIDINKLSGWRITFKFVKNDFFDVRIKNHLN